MSRSERSRSSSRGRGDIQRNRRFESSSRHNRHDAVSSPPKSRKSKRKAPLCVRERPQDLAHLYTYQDWIRDVIRESMVKLGVHVPFLPKLIVEYVPLYHWTHPKRDNPRSKKEKEADFMRVGLSHCDTVASNEHTKFGAVLGTLLDERCDHVISVKLEEGIEFGLGLCDDRQARLEPTKRDFMCCGGGFGYYNYKTKSPRMKPKYPPGLYCQTNTVTTVRDEEQIVQQGDVLTMVVQRQDVHRKSDRRNSGRRGERMHSRNAAAAAGGGMVSDKRSPRSRDARSPDSPLKRLDRALNRTNGPIKNTKPGAERLVSLSYYLNGRPMGFNLVNLRGAFHMCLNYYFVESTVRVLSEYRFRSVHSRWLREEQRRFEDKSIKSGPGVVSSWRTSSTASRHSSNNRKTDILSID